MPFLIQVCPLPCADFAIALAIPIWEVGGAVCVFDCRNRGGTIFALQVSSRISRRNLLIAGGFSPFDAGAVYVGVQPWLLTDEAEANLQHGDLIVFAGEHWHRTSVVTLPGFLQSDESVLQGNPLSLRQDEAAWIVTENSSFRFEVPPHRRSAVRGDLAFATGTPLSELDICPARPNIIDVAERGEVSRNVLAVTRTQGGRRDPVTHPIIFIDARPLLLNVSWFVCRKWASLRENSLAE